MKKINNTVRIIGGRFRGKNIRFPSAEGLRPTADRIRETLFNWLMHDIRNARCLDLFAGSGALGFEAHSRGAAEVVLIEKNPLIAEHLRQTTTEFSATTITIVQRSAADYLQNSVVTPFDIIFIDPPFAKTELYACIQSLEASSVLKKHGLIYVESPSELTLNPKIWQPLKFKTTGQVTYGLYQKIE